MRAIYFIEVVNGLPVLDGHRRWSGGNLFMIGGATALQLGPVAWNLFKGRLASDRIVPALVKTSLGLSSCTANPPPNP
ncbi:hypothetical protein IQ273_20895 [Nodosilinea sp. LEGE 07298]|uniref:hypothetical protein n=1 Tax=Nodosilinea sp. LEGE 07298 TaxID=2777970 RepID=UPI001882F7B5|nr:hypothetical protein [Nodosilinea sp. LEGE 07298]MBE9111869.1 hypothetical protein [Nodosilinea sp. LEGE 07298]